MVVDLNIDELRGIYKAIGIAKKEAHLKAVDLSVMPSTELAIKCLRQFDAYAILEAKILKLGMAYTEVVETIEELDDGEVYSPTVLGSILHLTPNEINNRLVSAGLQYKHKVSGVYQYIFTDKGRAYGAIVPHANYQNRNQLRWHRSVLNLIKK